MKARVGELELEYETYGTPDDPAVLLIMGLGAQMIAWPDDFCRRLAERGLFVIRFDNRDVGLSTHFDHLRGPTTRELLLRRVKAPYTLDDMAADAVGVLDHLGISRAHVVGASMGGMLAQLVAINHPQRVLSLTSIMSNLGGRDIVSPGLRTLWPLLLPLPKDRKGRIKRQRRVMRMLAGGNPIDEEVVLAFATLAVDRSYHPEGTRRQLGAVTVAASRREALSRLSLPALVIHGHDDPLVPIENGRRTAAAIPGARFLEIPRMGHNLPAHAWDPVIDAIVDLTQGAEALQTLS